MTKHHSVQICACGEQAFAQSIRQATVMVSAEDAWLLEEFWWSVSWQTSNVSYAVSRRAMAKLGAPSYLLHRIISGFAGSADHIDRNGFNNMRGNLRPATKVENARNAFRLWRHLPKGVSPAPRGGKKKKYRARIRVGSRELSLGYFATAEEGGAAYDAAAKRYFGEFARTNADAGR